MNLKIVSQEEQNLMNRIEVTADLTYEGATPSRVDIKKSLAAQLNTDPELVIVTKIATQYGFNKAIINANVYKKKEDVFEAEYMVKRQQPKSSGKKEEKPVEPNKEDAPATEGAKEEAKIQPKEASQAETKEETKKEAPKEEEPEKKE